MINFKYEPVCVKCDLFPIIEIDVVDVGNINIKCDYGYNDNISVVEYLAIIYQKKHLTNENNKLFMYCQKLQYIF